MNHPNLLIFSMAVLLSLVCQPAHAVTGHWHLTGSRFSATPTSAPKPQTVGGTVDIALLADGRHSLNITLNGSTTNHTGTFGVGGDRLILSTEDEANGRVIYTKVVITKIENEILTLNIARAEHEDGMREVFPGDSDVIRHPHMLAFAATAGVLTRQALTEPDAEKWEGVYDFEGNLLNSGFRKDLLYESDSFALQIQRLSNGGYLISDGDDYDIYSAGSEGLEHYDVDAETRIDYESEFWRSTRRYSMEFVRLVQLGYGQVVLLFFSADLGDLDFKGGEHYPSSGPFPHVDWAGSDAGLLTKYPRITDQSLSGTVEAGDRVLLKVDTVGEVEGYQWYRGLSGDTSSPVAAANESTFLFFAGMGFQDFWVRVSGPDNNADSETISIRGILPMIVDEPEDGEGAPGSPVSLAVEAEGFDLAYQWFRGDSGDEDDPIQGATSPSVQVTVANDIRNYWVKVLGRNNSVFSRTVTVAPTKDPDEFEEWAADAGLTGADAALDATPHNDGVPNLLKFAFNLDASRPDRRQLASGMDTGLPTMAMADIDGQPRLTLTFPRRKNSSLIYRAEFAAELNAWTTSDLPFLVEEIDGEWERVTAIAPPTEGIENSRFGRVRIDIP